MSATRKVHNATEGKGKGDDEIGYQGEGKRNTSDSWKEKDKNNKVLLSVQPHDSIYCDKFKMDQVVRNIVSNALKFTPRGGSVSINDVFVCDAVQDTSSCSTEPEVRTVLYEHT